MQTVIALLTQVLAVALECIGGEAIVVGHSGAERDTSLLGETN